MGSDESVLMLALKHVPAENETRSSFEFGARDGLSWLFQWPQNLKRNLEPVQNTAKPFENSAFA
jgi:hypothetical protein